MDKRNLIASHKKMMQKDSSDHMESDIDVWNVFLRVQSLEGESQKGEKYGTSYLLGVSILLSSSCSPHN